MPDDLAKKISEVLNHKPITPEDELSDAQEDMARDIAIIEPNPEDWGWWVGLPPGTDGGGSQEAWEER